MRRIISLLSVVVILCGAMFLPGAAMAGASINAKGADGLKNRSRTGCNGASTWRRLSVRALRWRGTLK
ncbi:MAG: hypothetical protein V1721_09715 [Pseudomonadota bacterium]